MSSFRGVRWGSEPSPVLESPPQDFPCLMGVSIDVLELLGGGLGIPGDNTFLLVAALTCAMPGIWGGVVIATTFFVPIFSKCLDAAVASCLCSFCLGCCMPSHPSLHALLSVLDVLETPERNATEHLPGVAQIILASDLHPVARNSSTHSSASGYLIVFELIFFFDTLR